MTVRAIAGLVVLNLVILGVGASVLWGIRGWRWWSAFLRLAGLAYLVGVASLTILLTLEVVLRIPFGLATFLASATLIAMGGVLVGALRGRSRPGLRPPRWRLGPPSLLTAAFAAAIALFLEALFRSTRLLPLFETDAWWVWTLRAKTLYFFGDLGPDTLVRATTLSYPPGLSLLHAAGFEAMGGPDTVTLHLQHWFFAVGFVAALVGLLLGRVRTAILLPFVLLTLVMPGFADRVNWAMADPLLAYLVAIGGLQLYLWLEDRSRWRLESATLLLGSAMLIKREGLILVLCVVAAALVASWGERRWAWPCVAAASGIALALAAPWRIFLAATGVRDAPTSGYLSFLDHPERALPSLRLVLETLFDPIWAGLGAIAVIALVLAFVAGERKLGAFGLTFLAASVLGSAFVIWSETAFEISQAPAVNPVIRMVLVTVLVVAPLVPLSLETAWRRGSPAGAPAVTRADHGRSRTGARVTLAWAIIGASLLLYPASMAAGYSGLALAGGAPRFPGPDECVLPATDARNVRVVLGYRETYADARALTARARASGLNATGVSLDDCGRLRVFLDDVPTRSAAGVVQAARAAGFEASLERDPDS